MDVESDGLQYRYRDNIWMWKVMDYITCISRDSIVILKVMGYNIGRQFHFGIKRTST